MIRWDVTLNDIYKEEMEIFLNNSSNALYTERYNAVDFYDWCKAEGYVKHGTMADYEVCMPTASVRICGKVATIHDLENYGKNVSVIPLQHYKSRQIIEFFKKMPNLLEMLEHDKQYYIDNYQKVRERAKKAEKLALARQAVIEAFVRTELDKQQLTYKLERKASRLYVIFKVGKYEAKYPIPNAKAENMTPMLEDLTDFVKALSKVPFGLKVRLKK